MNLSRNSLILLGLYALSGITALSYEVLWTRMLTLQFGTSIVGVVVTVAAFMLGLGLGSLLGSRKARPLKTTMLVLGGIEIAVALYAISLPGIMQMLQNLWLGMDDDTTWQFWQITSALLALSLPATALGFAFPWMLRAGQSMGCSLASLYGINTLGGAIGALLPLALLPNLGWAHALNTVAALGFLVGLSLLIWAVRQTSTDTATPPHDTPAAWLPMLVYAGMGAAALMLEMAWTRAYGMILLRTEYVLAVILFVFLCGIGIGSIIARQLPRTLVLNWAPLLAAATALLSLTAFPWVNDWGQSQSFHSLWAALAFQGSLIALFTLPVTLILGAWLPLIANQHTGARFYAANSLGACIGALLAGFVFMPWLGTGGTWVLAALLLMLCGLYWSQSSQRRVLFTTALVLMLWGGINHSLPSASRLLAHELQGAHDIFHREDAVSITHVVERQDGQRLLLADLQRMDAASDPTSVAVQRNQTRLPMFLHGHARRVLCLGLGTGITASGVLPWPQAQVDAVELSQGAIHAAPDYFKAVNGGLPPRRIHIIHDDARRHLMRSHQSYDVIVGDLFHPDMVGRGALLSVEQFQRAYQHLRPHGIFVQWLALNQFDIQDMQTVMHSFATVFTRQAVFIDGYRMALVGFHDDMPHASSLLQAAPDASLWGGEGAWTWLGRYWGDIEHMLPKRDIPLQSEWAPVIEYSLPHMRYQASPLPDMLRWLMQSRIHFGDAVKKMAVPSEQQQTFKRTWAATALMMRSEWEALQSRPGAMRLQQLAYRANPKDRWASFALADAMFESLSQRLPPHMTRRQALEKILSIRPDHEGALKAMYQLLQKAHDAPSAELYRQRLHTLSPYGRIES